MSIVALTLACCALALASPLTAIEPHTPCKQPSVIVLLGAPGAGKGTQAAGIASHYNLPHISTGDLFRENLRQQTPLGLKVKEIIDSGKLVPDQLVIDMLFDRVSKPDAACGYLLDGFPRTIPQAEQLEQKLGPEANLSVVLLSIDDEEVVKRLSNRRSCTQCKEIVNLLYSAPSKEGVCDKCKGELVQRSDDKPEVIRERLRIYHEQTSPLIDFYKGKKVRFVEVNAALSPEQVFERIKDGLQ